MEGGGGGMRIGIEEGRGSGGRGRGGGSGALEGEEFMTRIGLFGTDSCGALSIWEVRLGVIIIGGKKLIRPISLFS